MPEKIIARVRLRIYSRRAVDCPLYYTGGEVASGVEITLGEETPALMNKGKVSVRELIHHGKPSGFFVLQSELDEEFDQREQRKGIPRGPLRAAANY